jgi:flagellum-specific peptidoglycan hydrolase FlgJ
MAACEAALESAHVTPQGSIYGASQLAQQANNLFGMKQHSHPVYGTLNLPTKEFLHQQWVTVNADWVKYPDWATCFVDRMATLTRLAPAYPHYAAALAATDPVTYVTEVSRSWSTDPNRGHTVISIYNSRPQ